MKLLDQVRDVIRKRHYSIRTEEAYVQWIKRFILFHGKRHPKDMGEKEIAAYVSYLATHGRVASSTQNQALNAIIFLYKQVLKIEIGDLGQMERAKKPERLPVVLSKNEVRQVLAGLSGQFRLMGQLLYGCGLRLMECVRLRVKDIDFELNQIIVRDGKGMKDRSTMLPNQLRSLLIDHLEKVKITHLQDLENGFGEVYLPLALKRKYRNASKEGRRRSMHANHFR